MLHMVAPRSALRKRLRVHISELYDTDQDERKYTQSSKQILVPSLYRHHL